MHAAMNPSITILLPTLNECGNIDPLINRLLENIPSAHLVVIDDNSSDGTAEKVKDICLNNAAVRLIERDGTPCLTKSIQAGINCTTTEFVAWMDADFSHPPELVPQLLHAAVSCGCCIATRYTDDVRKSNNAREHGNLFGTLLSVVLNIIVRHILRLPITDYTSGFIVCRTALLKNHQLTGDYGEYFIELMHRLHTSGISIGEIAYTSPPRSTGYSKTGTTLPRLFRRGSKYLHLTLRLVIQRFGQQRVQKHSHSAKTISLCAMEQHHLRPVVSIHRQVLYNTLNTRAGENYLVSLYQTVLHNNSGAAGWVAYDPFCGITGFITITTDTAKTEASILPNFSFVNKCRLVRASLLHPILTAGTLFKMVRFKKTPRTSPLPGILTLGVHPLHQHRGIGRMLVDKGKNYCISKGCKELVVDTETTNIQARSFYLKNSFIEYAHTSTTTFLHWSAPYGR